MFKIVKRSRAYQVSTSKLGGRVQAGQDEYETLETLFRNIDLSFAKTALLSCFHTDDPGRPPRNPMGLFRTFIVMHMKDLRSLREMTRQLDTDQRLRRLCLIKQLRKTYKS